VVAHVDPETLALRSLGEAAGTERDDEHLLGCAACTAELGHLTELVALARRIEDADRPQAPSGEVWQRIMAEVGTDDPEPVAGEPVPVAGDEPVTEPGGRRAMQPEPVAGGEPRGGRPVRPDPMGEPEPIAGRGPGGRRSVRPMRRGRWRRPVAVALAGVLAGAGVTLLVQRVDPGGGSRAAQSALRPLPQFPQWRDATGTARLERDGSARRLQVRLRAPDRPGFYEVWLLARDGVSMISLGDLDDRHTALLTMPPGVDLADYTRVDVSLQPYNGSTSHTRDSVVRGPLP
jgi:Anti-sigma-K factor rskA